MLSKIVGYIIIGLLVVCTIIGLVALATWLLMLAWNASIPFIFGLPKINMLQAFCLSYVSTLLLKSSHYNTANKENKVNA